jgi:hypothetical protein
MTVHEPAPTLRLWTVQSLAVWELLQKKGRLFADPQLGDYYKHDDRAYDWMAAQMTKRVPDYPGGHPWWAWYSPLPRLRKLRNSDPAGAEHVRLTLNVPSKSVLLSPLNPWVMVMTEGYLAYSSREYEDWHIRNGLDVDDYNIPYPAHLQHEIELSWERVFEIEKLEAGGEYSTTAIQATFGVLDISQVVRVSHYVTVGSWISREREQREQDG